MSPSSKCFYRCRNHSGTHKREYTSFYHAKITAGARDWDVKVYACPWRPGIYHITHNSTSPAPVDYTGPKSKENA